jgi:hypothetical protein
MRLSIFMSYSRAIVDLGTLCCFLKGYRMVRLFRYKCAVCFQLGVMMVCAFEYVRVLSYVIGFHPTPINVVKMRL